MNITVMEQKIEYIEKGEGEAVVCLHGWEANKGLFSDIIETVSKKYRVIVPDLPGFGESPEPKEPWGVAEYTECIIEFLKALKIEKVTFIAHSFGGRIVFKFYERGNLPFEIQRLVLIDVAGVKPKKTLKQKAKLKIYKISKGVLSSKLFTKMFPDALETLRRKNGSADYNSATPLMRACLVKVVNEDLTHTFSKIDVPTLIIWGGCDIDTPLSDAKLMEEKISDSGLVVLEGAGHFSYLEQPVRVRRILESFLKI